MESFKKLSLGAKLISAFVFVSIISVVIGVIGIKNMSTINDMGDQIYESELLGLSYVKEANIDMLYLARAEKNFLLASSKEGRQELLDRSTKYEQTYKDNLAKAKPLLHSEKAKELYSKLEKANQEWLQVRKQVLELGMKEDLAEKRASADLSDGLAREKIDVVDGLLTELTRTKEANAKELSDETTKVYNSSRLLMIVFTAGGFVLGLLLGFLLTRSITKPVNRIIANLTDGANEVTVGCRTGVFGCTVPGRRVERAGGLDRGDLLVAGGDVLHDQAERGQRRSRPTA